MNETKLEILDVTLRDGEQTQGVVFSTQEKLNIAKFLLLNVKVDRNGRARRRKAARPG